MTVNQIEKLRKQLIFRSAHRGTKEMDLLLGSFAQQNVQGFTEGELREFEELLMHNDPDLYNWMTGKEDFPANLDGPVLQKLKAHKLT